MTTGDPLLPADHAARYCKSGWILKDQKTKSVLGIDPEAFRPRVENGVVEQEISANHVEYFHQANIADNVVALERYLKSIGRNLKKNGAFAVGQVAKIIAAGKGEGVDLEVREDSDPDDCSHAVILGIELDADLVQEAVARTMAVYGMASF